MSEINKLIKTFSLLSTVQFILLIIPFISYTYLIRVLGVTNCGLIAYSQTLISYVLLFVVFGFNISATQEVSIHKNNREKLSEIYFSVTIIKIIILIVAVCFVFLLCRLFEVNPSFQILLLLSFWICFDDILNPTWFFQGVQTLEFSSLVIIINKVICTIIIFVLVKNENDYLLVPIIFLLGTLISGFITFYYLLNKFKLHFSFQKIQNLEYYFQQSVPIFMSNFFIKLYVNSNKVILGAFVGMNEVAFYDLAEKITLISKIPQGIITQTIFPKISHEKDISVVKKIFKFSFLINCLLFVFLIVFGEKIVFYLGGEKMYPSVIILYIVSITIPIIALSNILGVQILVPFGFQRKFSFGVISGAFVYFIFVAISWILNYINIYSLAVITVLTEIYVTIYMFVTCKKLHLL